MAEPRPLTADHLSLLAAYLPVDLTEKQMGEVVRAAEHLAAAVWDQATAATGQRIYLMRQTLPEKEVKTDG